MPAVVTTFSRDPHEIRNVVLFGHAHAGKTSLADACLHVTGAAGRLGRVDDGTSVVDSDPEERDRHHSLDSHVLHIRHEGREINLIDVPGMPDLVNGAIGATAAVETAVIVVSAVAGIELGTRKRVEMAGEAGLARVLVVSKCDSEHADPGRVFDDLVKSFGRTVVAVNLPDGSGRDFRSVVDVLRGESMPAVRSVSAARTALVEAVVESDEALMERYLAGEVPDQAALSAALRKAMHAGAAMPVLFTGLREEVGVRELVAFLTDYAPAPDDLPIHRVRDAAGTSQAVKPDAAAPFVGQVFKVAHPPQRGTVTFVRVLAGRLRPDTQFTVNKEGRPHKAGHLFRVQGDVEAEVPEAVAGDIVALHRQEDLHLHDLLHENGLAATADAPHYPVPMFSLAVSAKTRADIEKVGTALHEISEEDHTIAVTVDPATGERVVCGLGELHLRTVLQRLRRRRGLEVDTKPPRIPYRETATVAVKGVEITHKKQSGGAGQYAKVVIDLEPLPRGSGYEFVDDIYGGSISQSFRPSVDKGVRQKLAEGVLAGYPVVDVRVRLVDGKEHPVDSKDIAFQVAGREAFRKAFLAARPMLLEPVVHLHVTVPEEVVGAVNGMVAARRGRIVGTDVPGAGMDTVKAEMPLSEVQAFGAAIQSATGGRGTWSVEPAGYEPVPAGVQAQLVAAYKPHHEGE